MENIRLSCVFHLSIPDAAAECALPAIQALEDREPVCFRRSLLDQRSTFQEAGKYPSRVLKLEEME